MSQPFPPSMPPPQDQGVSPEDFAPIGVPKRVPRPIDHEKARRRKKLLLTAGLIVAVLGVTFWILSRSGFVGVFASTGEPRRLAQEFVRALSEGSVERAMQNAAPGLSYVQMDRCASRMREWGAYQDLAAWNSAFDVAEGVTTCRLEGALTFGDGEHPFKMELVRDGETWKVSLLEID